MVDVGSIHSSIVDQNIYSAELREDGLDHPGNVFLPSDIRGDSQRSCPNVLDLTCRAIDLFLVTRNQHEIATRVRERYRYRFSEASACTGNNGKRIAQRGWRKDLFDFHRIPSDFHFIGSLSGRQFMLCLYKFEGSCGDVVGILRGVISVRSSMLSACWAEASRPRFALAKRDGERLSDHLVARIRAHSISPPCVPADPRSAPLIAPENLAHDTRQDYTRMG